MSDQLREFVAESREAALKSAQAHFGLGADRLEVYEVPASMKVSGLGSRVIVLAEPREFGGPLGEVGQFVRTLLELLGFERGLKLDERDEEGRSVVRVRSAGLEEAERRSSGVEAALSHLAERFAQKLGGEEASAGVVLVREGSSREGARRRSGGSSGGGQGRGERERSERPERGGRERGGRGGRGERPERAERSERRGGIDEAELEATARRSAEEAKRTGEPQLLPPMSSRERWVVHNAVKDVSGVVSESVGEGNQKRVQITPE